MNIHRAAVSTRTRIMVRRFAAVTAQVGLLWFMSWLGHQSVAFLHLPMPGNVARLLLTFLALTARVLPLRVLEPGAGLLVRNLPVFFVPLAVGFVTEGRLLAAHGFAIMATLIVSAAIGFAVTGRMAQLVSTLQGIRHRRESTCSESSGPSPVSR